ncbi:alpha/beta fold hydrolase [Sphingomonas sp. 37zxx]|uniref:alpha/beta fold hydrolase n=1 Tax=Sphingomonas sp. 37zxx TaxID=1550073 RepID=UPI00053C0208|nr:alpha/beta hydrolase [Sphingomonas sp. 37zxx]
MAGFEALRRAIPIGAHISRWAAPDGWDHRRFDWPSQRDSARGSILFLGGRGDVFEKYIETFGHWHAQGWSIASFDWRGQGGSGRCSPAAHCGHVESFADYGTDLAAFWREWREGTPGPHVVIGHSMGGYLVLRALVDSVFAPDAAVLVAPMLGLKGPVAARLGEGLAALMLRLGDPARAAWKGNERPATTETRQTLLTHDADRYADEIWWQLADPLLMTGPPSWNWVAQAFTQTRLLRQDARLAAMSVPLLGLIADADRLVDPRAAIATLGQLPDSEICRFGAEAAHEILREADPVRDRALAAIDRFLDARAAA